MQEAGAGVTTVTTPGERHRTTPSTTALHMLATCDPPVAVGRLTQQMQDTYQAC